MRATITSVVMTAVVGWLAVAAQANDQSRAQAADAIAVCESADELPAGDKTRKIERLEQGLRLAQTAVASDDQDARAHFAVACNLGKQLDLAGLSWRIFGQVRRMQAEIDRAQALAPDDPDVLVTKGELLRRLPGPLGGNKDLALALLRRAVELKPDHVAARLYLARAKAAAGAPDARATVYEALAVAKRCGAVREESEAEDLLAALDD